MIFSDAGVTAIEPGCLPDVAKPLCTWSGPLPEPAPAYTPTADEVQCWQYVTFGKHDWPLPAVAIPHTDAHSCTAVFAAALLAGHVLPVFQGEQTSWQQQCYLPFVFVACEVAMPMCAQRCLQLPFLQAMPGLSLKLRKSYGIINVV